MNGKISSYLKNPFTVGAVAILRMLKQQKSLLTMTFFGILMLFPAMQVYADEAPAAAAATKDLFSGGKEVVKSTFGKGSTVVWILYVLEILAAIFAYVKTKNLAVFGGIAAVIVFVNVVFGLI
ncbi:type IV conjugative transfer system pilin TraA [Arsenophonus sp. PmNCSU2021_1]|uniref:type IV conjugative transfer system pilin TraA n=1 Tax=Arsenophonus sp. PmNCSU2021_1 TaxID=3118989 RepID=UPI002FEFE803